MTPVAVWAHRLAANKGKVAITSSFFIRISSSGAGFVLEELLRAFGGEDLVAIAHAARVELAALVVLVVHLAETVGADTVLGLQAAYVAKLVGEIACLPVPDLVHGLMVQRHVTIQGGYQPHDLLFADLHSEPDNAVGSVVQRR